MKKKIVPKRVSRFIQKMKFYYNVWKAGPIKIQVDFGGKY